MPHLNSLTINQRLIALFILVIIGFSALVALSLTELRSGLLESKIEKAHALSDTAFSIAQSFHQRQQSGELSEKEAQQATLDALRVLRYEDGNYFWVNDMEPTMLMHPVSPEMEGTNLSSVTDPNGLPIFKKIVELVHAQEMGKINYQWSREKGQAPIDKVSYVKGFKPWGWVIGTGIYIDDVDVAFNRTMMTELVEVAIILMILAPVLLMIKNSIVNPIRNASTTMSNIAKNYDLTQRLPETGRDEISDMAKSFNRYIQSMESIVQQVGRSANDLASASESLSVVAGSTQSGIQNQQGETQQVTTAVSEMSSTVKEIARSAEEAAVAAQGADENAKDGRGKVDGAITSISSLAEQIQQTTSVVQQLNVESEAIGSVLDVIRGIAEQTNLLALNAAIEAARAGEQGRGFAVVADEVRSLAGRTQESTTEIQTMIERLQAGSLQAVSAIGKSRETAEETVEQAHQAGNALNAIVGAVGTINDMNSQIACAAEEQASVAQQIDHNVETIAGLANETTDNAIQTSSASEQLARLGEHMNELVGRFKTNQN